MNLAERVGSRQNNFNALRLIAAVMVLVSHCFALTNRPEPLATISQESLRRARGLDLLRDQWLSHRPELERRSGDPAVRRQAGAPLAAGTDRGRAAHRARARSGGHDSLAVALLR